MSFGRAFSDSPGEPMQERSTPGFRNAFADGSMHGEAQGAMSLLNSGRALMASLAPFMVPNICFCVVFLFYAVFAVGAFVCSLSWEVAPCSWSSPIIFVHTSILKTKS